jgi:hypothetical protein
LIDQKLDETFCRYKRQIFASVIFDELLNEMASSLFAKEIVSNAMSAYTAVDHEDKELEAASFQWNEYQNYKEGQEEEEL